jgi:alpha-L-rhamnosidase
VRDLLDDPRAWAQVVDVAVGSGLTPRGQSEAAARLAAYLDAPVAVVPHALAPEDRFPAAHIARDRLTSVLRPHT